MVEDIHRIFRSRQTIEQMMIDRGYSIKGTALPSYHSAEDFDAYESPKGYRVEYAGDKRELRDVYVRYFPDKMNKEDVDNLIHEFGMSKVTVIVVYGSSTPNARNLLQMSYDCKFELFTIDELQVNPVHHALEPNTKRLTKEEADIYINDPNGKPRRRQIVQNLPKIPVTDIVSRYLGWQRGDIIYVVNEDIFNDQAVTVTGMHYLVI